MPLFSDTFIQVQVPGSMISITFGVYFVVIIFGERQLVGMMPSVDRENQTKI